MIDLNTLGTMAGGLGLFLFGMGTMTDGLKLAAGPALHRILSGATRTRWHALGSGALVTTLVQSSSAVTVAAIGFINAGLLALAPTLWVLFGANVGSTTTGWLVALVGLKFKIEAFALPLIGAGMLLKLTGEGRRPSGVGGLGNAIAGFGLLFLGIGLMQQAFTGVAGQLSLPQGTGLWSVLAQLGIGLAMTVVMQSSSASIAIALTAAQGGLIDARGAAAVVIGANIGTTVTALLAAVGATPNARRAASAHVIFNLITACVALTLLPWLVGALSALQAALGLPDDPAAKLALFHTSFNLLGILLMWPIADALTRWLQKRFRSGEDDEARPRHLDDNVLAVPTLALDALAREAARAGQVAVRMTRAVVAGIGTAAIARDHAILISLDAAIAGFVERLHRVAMSPEASARLAELLRIQRYNETAAEQVWAAAALAPLDDSDSGLSAAHAAFAERVDRLAERCDPGRSESGPPDLDEEMQAMESHYESLKSALLAAGAAGRLALPDMERALRRCSALRRATQQLVKARRRLPGEGNG